MSKSICFKCGEDKNKPFDVCPNCKVSPRQNTELVLSMALSEHMLSKDQLAVFSESIKAGHKPSIPHDVLQSAREALKDEQLMSLLNLANDRKAAAAEEDEIYSELDTEQEEELQPNDKRLNYATLKDSAAMIRSDAPEMTALHYNAFNLLGVTTRDNRRLIVEAAEGKCLVLDESLCIKARSDLTNPRNRLFAEMAWLPGISPKRASDLAALVKNDSASIINQHNIPPLPFANLLAASFEMLSPEMSPIEWAEWIDTLAETVEEIDTNDIFRDINEDRAISGFPEVKSIDAVESELVKRKRYYKNSIKEAINRLPTMKLVEVITDVVEAATDGGDLHATHLIDEIVDSYEVESQGFLNQEAENILKLVEATRVAASDGKKNIMPMLTKLDKMVRHWDKVAQPIQVSMKSRGLDHDMSMNLSHEIRGLGIDLFNKHDSLEAAQLLVKTLQEVFAELPEVVERLEEDASALEDIEFSRLDAEREAQERAEEIQFRADLGTIVKKTLAISPKGVQWKNTVIPLENIARIRWGATRHTINGIPAGTTHTIYFGDNNRLMHVETKKAQVYGEFIDKLWKAVGVRLLIDMLHDLREGEKYWFGDAVIDDHGAEVTKSKFLAANQRVYGTWDQLHIGSGNGCFVIGMKGDKKASSAISYQDDNNTHVLESAIRASFKNGYDRLSDLLE